ncbi:MAG TPA: DUF4190 domain-containing protein [Pyrinomonadaceae bacterium]|nr:DUF4190 domain-containing protein [Pyrinomonadaceae bacterium]
MKQCPRCNLTYSDDRLNFCLDDGELLTAMTTEPPLSRYADDAPPTVMLDSARRTNPANWPNAAPAAQPIAQWSAHNAPAVQQPFPYAMNPSPNQVLAIVSLGLGVGSMTIGWCCSLGLLLSPAALITGFLALSYIKKDPQAYGGRGFAIGGIVTGSVFLALYLLFIIIYGVAIIGGGLSGM